MPKTELSDDLARRIASARGQLERLEREAQPWQLVRDQLISEAKRTGASARTIGAAAGVSHTYVAQLPSDLDTAKSSEPAPALGIVESAGCSCAEPGYSILGSCRSCGHDGAEHDQKGCHHA